MLNIWKILELETKNQDNLHMTINFLGMLKVLEDEFLLVDCINCLGSSVSLVVHSSLSR